MVLVIPSSIDIQWGYSPENIGEISAFHRGWRIILHLITSSDPRYAPTYPKQWIFGLLYPLFSLPKMLKLLKKRIMIGEIPSKLAVFQKILRINIKFQKFSDDIKISTITLIIYFEVLLLFEFFVLLRFFLLLDGVLE